MTAADAIRLLGLEPHPAEGGFFRETYRADEGETRSISTAIYYLLTPETLSALHRLASDEVFHHYAGDPVEQLHLYPDGTTARIVIGSDLAAGQRPQVVVPRGVWQGARLVAGGRWALMGCTVAPGFDFADYEHGERAALIAGWPGEADMIAALTP
jgi:predicted cupin superfamily sugar epimerase